MQRFDYEKAPGGLWLNEVASGISYLGSFKDDESNVWDEGQIADFIRFGRPDLFKALQRLPISAEDLPTPANLGLHFLTPDERVLVNQSTVIDSRGSYANPQDRLSIAQCQNASLYRYRTLKLQHKRYIQTRVLSKSLAAFPSTQDVGNADKRGGHDMLLRCANQFSCYFPCSAPYCNGAAGRGGFFVTLRSTPDQQDVHYCMQCLEGLYTEQNMIRQTHQRLQYYTMDGAAESRPSPVPMPYNFPSNSIENRRLRQKRAEEIDEVLHSVKKRKEASADQTSDSDTELSLRIQRPDDLEEADQRYKKQRLTQYDQRKDRIASKRQEQQQQQQQDQDPHHSETQTAMSGPVWNDEPRLICYCREPQGISQLIRCSNEYCLIGLFHIQCCTEDPRFLMNEKFFCEFCIDRVTSFESDTSAESLLDAQSDGRPPTATSLPALTSSSASDDIQQKIAEEEETFHVEDINGDTLDIDTALSSPGRALPASPSAGGFTPINQRFHSGDESPRPLYLDGTIDSKIRPVTTYRQAPALLADFASLTDIAPFMSYEVFPDSPTGLQQDSIMRFEAWRYSMPASRLLANLKPGRAVSLQDLPRSPRQDLRKQAGVWVDRLVHEEHKKLDGRLYVWMEGVL